MKLDVKKYLQEKKELIDGHLRERWLNPQVIAPPQLFKAMEYSAFAPGKRIRPALVFASAEALGIPEIDVVPVAASLEMIHVFSLIHDDLPAMDDDSLRRGQPTNHKVFGEALAILAGDALLAHAFLPLTDINIDVYSAKSIVRLIRDFSKFAGVSGMTAGQVLDMQAENTTLSLDELKKLHLLKTGALITLAVTAPAVLTGVSDAVLTRLTAFGQALGLTFQITDDILDVEGGAELGKDIGSDANNNKSTYVKLLGLDGAKKEAKKMQDLAFSALADFDSKADTLRAIARFVVDRKN